MAEIRDAQAQQKGNSDQFADVSLESIYHLIAFEQQSKLSKSFSSLQSQLDSNRDSDLDLDELGLAAVRKNFGSSNDAAMNTFLQSHYYEIAGLARSQYDTTPESGITRADMNELSSMLTADRRRELFEQHRSESLSHVDDARTCGVGLGLLGGVLAQTSLKAAGRFIPGKFKTVAALAGFAAPTAGVLAGYTICGTSERNRTEYYLMDKQARTSSVFSSGLDSLTTMSKFGKVATQRLEPVLALPKVLDDIDNNGFVDRSEIQQAIKSQRGNAEVQQFASTHYKDLELLSKNVENKSERGISMQAVQLLTDSSYRHTFFEDQEMHAAKQSKVAWREGTKDGLLTFGLGATLAAMGVHYLPAKAKPFAFLGAGAAVVVGIYANARYASLESDRQNNELLNSQRGAVLRLYRNL